MYLIVYIFPPDIDECSNGFNGGCEDRCENLIMSIDNVTHECFCDDVTQTLANNNLDCVGKSYDVIHTGVL